MALKRALIIGNSQYERLSRLVTPVEDVRALVEVLVDPQIGGFHSVQSLIDCPFAELQAQVAAFFSSRAVDDLLLLYFSGHGLLDQNNKLYLATLVSTSETPSANSLDAGWIREQMTSSDTRRQVLVLDCCFGGVILRHHKAGQPRPVDLEENFQGRGRIILAASDRTQYSFEGLQTEGRPTQSLFTRCLVEGLRTGGADFDGDGLVSVDDWYDYAYERVTRLAPGQTPVKGSFEQRGKVILARAPRRVEERVVDPAGLGQHTTITAAIQAASPGASILIRPGVYNEGLVIDRPLHLSGQGDLNRVVLQAAGKDVIVWKAESGSLKNLRLRQEGGKFYAVDIAAGSPLLEGCDITSQGLACVAIHGGASPVVRANRIHDSKSAGIFIYDGGRGLIEDNEIYANAFAGVAIETGASPTVRANRIHDGKAGGVYVYENGQGLIENNEIYANAAVEVEIKTGASPTVRANRIHLNVGYGIRVYDNGAGTLERNVLSQNKAGAFKIDPACLPNVKQVDNREDD